MARAVVAVVMGSSNDWPKMEGACIVLKKLDIPYLARVVSAHRTSDEMITFAKSAKAQGFKAIIAGAGGSAHLPGMLAANTLVPVIGVPIPTDFMGGLDSLLSINQMPNGTPVATMPVGKGGAPNAALLTARMLAVTDEELYSRLLDFREAETQSVLSNLDPEAAWNAAHPAVMNI